MTKQEFMSYLAEKTYKLNKETILIVFTGLNDGYFDTVGLSVGKIYESCQQKSIYSNREYYILTNDLGIRYSYDKTLFKTLDEVRNERIDTLLN